MRKDHEVGDPRSGSRRSTAVWAACAVGLVLLGLGSVGCTQLSEEVEDPAAGVNGGFEHVRDGLPVNWLVYSPSTIPSGRYELGFDTGDFKEGSQSLRFDIEECSADGGWRSPGISQEFPVDPGDYRVHFWIKSDGADYVVTAGGVTAKTGAMSTIDSARADTGGWRLVEQQLSLDPEYDRLRFELSIRSPGTLWIDDIRIDPVVPL